jgi:hypothetical protein
VTGAPYSHINLPPWVENHAFGLLIMLIMLIMLILLIDYVDYVDFDSVDYFPHDSRTHSPPLTPLTHAGRLVWSVFWVDVLDVDTFVGFG